VIDLKQAAGATVGLALAAVVVVVAIGLMFLGGQTSRSLGGPIPRALYGAVGDWDIACSGSDEGGNPTGCSTPLPSLEPDAVARAVPLEIASRDIPVTAVGPAEVLLGQATLANGVLHEATFRLAGIEPGNQVLPAGFTIADQIYLDVRPTDPSRPAFGNGYRRGWHPGTEIVNVYLTYDITSFSQGAVIPLRDVLVH
jgi:hypothetical protein